MWLTKEDSLGKDKGAGSGSLFYASIATWSPVFTDSFLRARHLTPAISVHLHTNPETKYDSPHFIDEEMETSH